VKPTKTFTIAVNCSVETIPIRAPEKIRPARSEDRAQTVDRVKARRPPAGIGNRRCNHAASKGSVPPIRIVGPTAALHLKVFQQQQQEADTKIGEPS